MQVTLMEHSKLETAAHAVRTCWQSFGRGDDGGPKDKALLNKVGNVYRHASTLEHLRYTFYIQGISRALLQELARHRIASLSVKSSRYTLSELKNEQPFNLYVDEEGCVQRSRKYLIDFSEMTKDPLKAAVVEKSAIVALENLRMLVASGIPNDIAKYAIPDAYLTELTWSINARSLQNFLKLRTGKKALHEIRVLAYKIFDNLPADHKYLFVEFVEPRGYELPDDFCERLAALTHAGNAGDPLNIPDFIVMRVLDHPMAEVVAAWEKITPPQTILKYLLSIGYSHDEIGNRKVKIL